MTRQQMNKEIRLRLKEDEGVVLDRETVDKFLDIEEDIIYEIIATCDQYKFLWGTISGYEKFPYKITGKHSELNSVKLNGGYSNWKIGMPKISWSNLAKMCDMKKPEEYFTQPWVKYTSFARKYRKDAGKDEIDEYKDLSEEKIQELCQKADEQWKSVLTRAQKKNIKKEHKSNTQKTIATHLLWEQNGYKPMGVQTGENEYKGEQRDTVDHFMSVFYKEDDTLQNRLETVLDAMDIRAIKVNIGEHLELEELRDQILKEMEEKGEKPIVHINKQALNQTAKRPQDYRNEKLSWSFMEERMQQYEENKKKKEELQEQIGEDNKIAKERRWGQWL